MLIEIIKYILWSLNYKDLFAFFSIYVDWMRLYVFKSRTTQNPSFIFPISSNPRRTGIIEQDLNSYIFIY